MNVETLKNLQGYKFECYIKKVNTTSKCIDVWGGAFIWLNNEIGVEYNLSLDNSTDELSDNSAIYKSNINQDNGYIETNYSVNRPYKINFEDLNWKLELENEMCKCLIELFSLK